MWRHHLNSDIKMSESYHVCCKFTRIIIDFVRFLHYAWLSTTFVNIINYYLSLVQRQRYLEVLRYQPNSCQRKAVTVLSVLLTLCVTVTVLSTIANISSLTYTLLVEILGNYENSSKAILRTTPSLIHYVKNA